MSYDIRTVRRRFEVERYYNVRCDECQAPLEPNGPVDADGGWHWTRAMGALKMRLISDPDSFFDSFRNTDPLVILCHTCATRLVDAFPGIKHIIWHVDEIQQPGSSPFLSWASAVDDADES